ncbi:hypothetical protein Riv7116_4336 [Rivularia sp. PCC 7116]|nr:hypothetical protein Riv7116_4336 [Rivularia sp. PCC 7116]
MMIRALVESAFQTGYLSVESEGLLHQMLANRIFRNEDTAALTRLCDAVRQGLIKREASSEISMEFLAQKK